MTRPKPRLGLDLEKDFYNSIINALNNTQLDISKIESYSQVSQNRNALYDLLDTMGEDSTIAAVLETYTEDATETNENGRIVWAESSDQNVTKYVTYLLDTINVDKNAYRWIYSLIKYGDLYLRLFRESEYNDDLFNPTPNEPEENNNKTLNEDISKILDENIEIPDKVNIDYGEIDDITSSKNIINEDVVLKLYSKNDRYVHYLEMIPNPCTAYELTRFGKTYAYIVAPNTINIYKPKDAIDSSFMTKYNYSFKKNDVNLYEATEFVHAALDDNTPRVPEEVSIYLTDADYEADKKPLTYTVRKGQSLLYSAYKIWRELMLLEYSLLLNRITKSSIVRIIGVEVGDMPKENIGPHLSRIKSLFEQKSALNVGMEMAEYTNPGPVENNIYVPTHGGVGAISPQEIGGDANVKGLEDLEYFINKLFASLRIPKHFFGFCLRGDTKLPLLNGETLTIKELYDNRENYIGKGILSCKSDGTVEPTIIEDIQLTRENAQFVRVYLDNDKFIDVTPDHRMMLRDGTFIQAKDLNYDDILMPNTKVTGFMYLSVVEPAYDITVKDNHTFATEAGVFVHNCNDEVGFNGGTSLSIISSRYAKTVKRIQNTFIQAITDAINLMLLDKGLVSYVNKFKLKMVSPTTQEEIDKHNSIQTKIGIANDIMQLMGDVPSILPRLKVLKSLLNEISSDPVVVESVQEEIDRLKDLIKQGYEIDENGGIIEGTGPDANGLDGSFGDGGPMGGGGDFGGDLGGDMGGPPDMGGGDLGGDMGGSDDGGLPSPDSLGVDFTQNS